MSSTVCHRGLQSSLEPLVKLKLTPPRSNCSSTSGWDCNNPQTQEKMSHIETTITNTNSNNLNLIDNKDKKEVDKAGWSFLQSLANPTSQTTKTEQVYVHPLAKRSASVLSPRSLEVCTESLGSETGSEHGGDDMSFLLQSEVDIASLSLESSGKINPTSTPTSENSKISSRDNHNQATPKRLKRTTTTSFPPPLTIISGSNGVQVRPHREGGRLVLKAVSVISPPTAYFQAERGDGRLSLRLLKELPPNCDIEEAGEEDDDGGEELAVEDDQRVEVGVEEENGVQNRTEAAENEVYNCEEEKDFDVETEMELNSENVVETEEMDGNVGNVVGEKGTMGKLPSPSRCKDGHAGGRGNKKMVMNWPESFWVAT